MLCSLLNEYGKIPLTKEWFIKSTQNFASLQFTTQVSALDRDKICMLFLTKINDSWQTHPDVLAVFEKSKKCRGKC